MVKGAEGKSARGAVAAIGNFDGVHLGHRMLLAETAAFAREQGAPFAAVVFDPHPRRFFRPGDPPFLITTPEIRDALLRQEGVEDIMTLRFDAALAGLAPEDFVLGVLARDFGLSGVVVGEDFRFGKGRAGDADALSRFGKKAGLAVRLVAPKWEEGHTEKIGSSGVRAAIRDGDMKAAARVLGRPWTVRGRVEEGQKLGRTLGFPTANLTVGPLIEPRRGVYAARATLRGKAYDGVANFGRRPTVGEGAPLLEIYLFDFDGEFYGEIIDIALIDFIREERKFDTLDALKAQIAADCETARAMLSKA
ncbi:MAG: bifunctional riboflavin kinase/FAD synthetase [Parvularculaceae bacterium]